MLRRCATETVRRAVKVRKDGCEAREIRESIRFDRNVGGLDSSLGDPTHLKIKFFGPRSSVRAIERVRRRRLCDDLMRGASNVYARVCVSCSRRVSFSLL